MKRTALFLVVLIGLIALIAGCAGGAVNFNTWAADYAGSGTLDNDKVGQLEVTCDSNGIVTGTLTVTGTDGTESEFKFTPGAYNLSGSITSTGGNFEVSGEVPEMGGFFIRGNFPTDGSSRDYKVVTEATETYPTVQSYDGTLARVP